MHASSRSLGVAAVVVALAGACASSPGAGGSGGSVGSGGVGSGGSGGAVGTGGMVGTGGATGSGGAVGSGGVAVGTGGSAGRGGAAGGPGAPGGFGGGAMQSGGAAGTAAGGSGAGGLGITGASRCATAGVQLCEDFENGLDAAVWTTRKVGDATVTVDDVHAARGTKALHIKTAAGGSGNFGYISEKKSFPATNNILYGRMFVWFEDALTTDGHFTLAEGAGTGTPAVIRFGGQNKFFGVGTDSGSSGDWTDKDNKLIPAQTWICAEFEFKGDTHEFHVWWDDGERTALHSGPSNHSGFTMPQFNSLWFGWWMYNMAEPQELWIDEIAVDFKPIGCTK
jgi:hypothetical protein